MPRVLERASRRARTGRAGETLAAKVTIVRLRRFSTPVLPVAGGVLFTLLIAVWYTSALWFFREVDVGL